jgi:hypothetical protein
MRNVLLVVVMMVAGILAAGAQDNAVATKKKDALKEQGEKIQKEESSGGGDADMIRIKATDLPRVIRKVLQSTQYKGWDAETSTIYGSEENDLYVIEIHNGKEAKTYYFDGDGKPIMN